MEMFAAVQGKQVQSFVGCWFGGHFVHSLFLAIGFL